MDEIKNVCGILDANTIEYEIIHHPAVYTMDEVQEIGLGGKAVICKNLFLCDDKGKVHFLVVLSGEKQVNLKKLAIELNCKNLRFASEKRLYEYLKLTKGAVTPFGIIHDTQQAVTVVFDNDLIGLQNIGVHPNDNTATIVLSFDSLRKMIAQYKNPIKYILL